MLYDPEQDSSKNEKPKPQIILGLTNHSVLFLSQNQADTINESFSNNNEPYTLVDFDNVSSTTATFVPLYKEKEVKKKLKKIKEKKGFDCFFSSGRWAIKSSLIR